MPKYAIFLTFLLVTFLVCLVWMLQCTETLILLQTFSLQVNLFQKHFFHALDIHIFCQFLAFQTFAGVSGPVC